MISRIARLLVAEAIKVFSQPFLYIGLAVVAAATLLAAWLGPIVTGEKETIWRSYHSVQLFAYGFKWGIKFAGFVLVIFSAMTFAGEFDRGTIKNLLTRPITRTDLFLAKCLAVLGLGVGLYLFVLWTSLVYAFARGELGPVWLSDMYHIQRSSDEIVATARKAVLISFLPFLAAGFLGILVSTWTESSGYGVAMALVLFLFGDAVTEMNPFGGERWSFFYYPSYVLERLRAYSEGNQGLWDESIETRLLFAKVPLAYVAGFLPLAFVIFRRRNITT